ncbi:ComEC/Rec2 family competence protein [Niastella sp. OAS944]|uniref:ComEC/Rec2 family competence protein n=1 Tax=Niastella sp. OAS944 TaxID=2664089 RepID=UPI00347C7D37|nr:beta-lactamase superfamily II metal-dependent hydrolase [Chitinophagaceae bacterium OAS944]
MEVKFLKAGSGDSIIIHHKIYNIVIDGGNDSKYLLSEIDNIYKNNEVINLLVITHHDDDHIKGIIDLLNHVSESKYDINRPFIEKVIFNSPRLILGKLPKDDNNLLSYRQAHIVEELLQKINTNWTQYTDQSKPIVFEDLIINILSPAVEDLKEYSLQKGAYLTSDWKCDWKIPMWRLEPYITDKSQDKSISNKSSIVFQISCDNKKLLLTGDVTPGRLQTILDQLSAENGGLPVQYDIVKLPHHGSYRSLNKSILEKLKCNTFIISTNGKKYFLPNKRALLKVAKYSKRINGGAANFFFNYEETLNNIEIHTKEKIDYNFIVTPNNENYGIHFRYS